MAGALGIVAGGGDLPRQLAQAALAQGRAVFVLGLTDQADPDTLAGFDQAWVRVGEAGAALAHLRGAGVSDLVLAGKVKRPSFFSLKPDATAAGLIARIGMRAFGDDGLLGAIVQELEREGFRVLGVQDILGDLLATPGPLGACAPDAVAETDILRGFAVAKALGAADIGQAVVVQGGVVLGVEAIEGTDALILRCRDLHRAGPGGVLVKVAKPQQETRIDLPAIGPATVENAIAAGLRGIAVETGSALVIDRARMVALADESGLFVTGVTAP